MRNRNVVIGAVVVSLVVGALVGSTLAASGTYGNEAPSFTVPVARIGDEVEYVVRGTSFQDGYGAPTNETSRVAIGLRVNGIATARDATLLEHDALDVTLVEQSPTGGAESTAGPGDTFYIDLASRHIIQSAHRWEIDEGDYTERTTDHRYGPWSSSLHTYRHFDQFMTPLVYENVSFDAQGRTFQLSEDLSDETLQGLFQEKFDGGRFYVFSTRILDYEFEAQVEGHGYIGDYEVFGLVHRVSMDYVNVDDEYEPGRERLWHEEQTTTYWLSPDVPWPVRIEKTLVRHGEDPLVDECIQNWNLCDPVRNRTFVQDLVRYEPGEQPVEWRPWEPDHYRDSDPGLRRGPAGTNHVVGGDGRLPYAFDEAVENVQADPTMTEFGAWLEDHPQAELVGVWFEHQPPAGASSYPALLGLTESRQDWVTWNFVYADPGPVGAADQAYAVASSLHLDADTVTNHEFGQAPLNPLQEFTIDDLPERPVTLAYLDQVWQGLAPPEVGAPVPMEIGWGYSPMTPYMGQQTDTAKVTHIEGAVRLLDRVYVGEFDIRLSPQPPSPEAPYSFDLAGNRMAMEAETGHLLFSWFSDQWVAAEPLQTPLGEALADGPSPSTTHQGDAGPPIDPFVAAAVTAASLLSVILFVYFLPTLRYAGAWFVGIIPGYAKLKKSELLDNEYRERIVELVRQEPGISPPELHKKVGGGWSTIVYHLRVLEKNEILTSTIDGRHKRVFPAGEIDRRDIDAAGVLRNERTREFYDLIDEDPGLHQSEMARRVGISHASTRWHLRRLEEVGLVGSDRIGRKVCYYAVKSAPAALDQAVEVA